MSEMEYEEAPSVHVPWVRLDWFGDAFDSWTRAWFGPRRGVTIVWGCLFIIPWAIFQLCKLAVYAGGLMVLVAALLFWVPAELMTHHARYRRAVLAKYGPYMGELYGEG